MLMKWGIYTFDVKKAAYDTLVRVHGWRWTEQKTVGGYPRHQFMGVDEETLRISGVIYSSSYGGIDQPNQMRKAADKGVAHALTDATGKAWGQYACRSISETQSLMRSDGTPRKQVFELTMVRVIP